MYRQEASLAAEALAAQDKEMNTVRYCVGTSSDLKEMNLIKSGRVVTENANMSYFTKTDLRELSQIPPLQPQGSPLDGASCFFL